MYGLPCKHDTPNYVNNERKEKMSPIKIEDDVPIPARVVDRTPLPELPLDDMTAGQSFKLEITDGNLNKTLNALRMKIQRYQKKYAGAKFSVVTETPDVIRVFCRASN